MISCPSSLYSSCLFLLPRPYLPSFIPSEFQVRSLHSPFQSQCSTDVDLLLRISISRIIFLSKRLSSSCLRLLLHPHPPPIFPSVCYESWTTVHSKLVLHRGWSLVSYFSFPNNPLSPILYSSCLRLLLHPHLPSVFPSLSYDCLVHSQFQSDFFTELDVTRNTPC